MRRSARLATLMIVACAGQATAQSVVEARAALRSGEYAEATRSFRRLLRDDESSVEARRGLVRALEAVGDYEEAETIARDAPNQVMMANTLGVVIDLRGEGVFFFWHDPHFF